MNPSRLDSRLGVMQIMATSKNTASANYTVLTPVSRGAVLPDPCMNLRPYFPTRRDEFGGNHGQ